MSKEHMNELSALLCLHHPSHVDLGAHNSLSHPMATLTSRLGAIFGKDRED